MAKQIQTNQLSGERHSLQDLVKLANPIAGLGFDPERDIQDFSDDSSDEDDIKDYNCFDEDASMCNDFSNSTTSDSVSDVIQMPIQRVTRIHAVIMMPIRVKCLYG